MGFAYSKNIAVRGNIKIEQRSWVARANALKFNQHWFKTRRVGIIVGLQQLLPTKSRRDGIKLLWGLLHKYATSSRFNPFFGHISIIMLAFLAYSF
jgi:hypothetical protein